MKKRLYHIVFAIIITLLSCSLMVACTDQGGNNKLTVEDSGNPNNSTQITPYIAPNFDATVTSKPMELPLTMFLEDLGINVDSEKILENNCTSYTGVSESAAESYMAQYITAGWTNAEDGVFFKDSTVVAMVFEDNNDFVIIEIQFSSDVAESIRSAFLGGQDGDDTDDDTVVLHSISVDTNKLKKEYLIDETLDTSGLIIIEHMSDSSEETGSLSNYTVDSEHAFNSSVDGLYTIRITNNKNSSIYYEYQVRVCLKKMENITCKDVIVDYDGASHSIAVINIPDGATVTYSLDTEVAKEYTSVNPSYTLPTNVTVYYKVSKVGYEDYKNSALLRIDEDIFEYGSIEILSCQVDYDGESHNATISSIPEGSEISFSTDSGTDKVYSATNPSFINAGKYTVFYKVTKEGYVQQIGNTSVTINKIEIEGIRAQGFIGIAGTDGSITVSGTETGDVIEYCESIEDTPDVFSQTNIIKNTECNAKIKYRVSRGANYEHIGSATITLVRNQMLTGITFNGITEDWSNGIEYSLSINNVVGAQNEDIIYFSEDGENNWKEFSSVGYEEPGTYPVYLKLLRIGAGYYTGSANIIIEKLDYTANNVTGYNTQSITWNEGMTFATIAENCEFADVGIKINNLDVAVTAKTYTDIQAIFNPNPDHYNDYPFNLTIVVYPKTIPDGDITVSDYEGVFDGQPHGAIIGGTNSSAYVVYFKEMYSTTWDTSLTYSNVKKDGNLIQSYSIEWKVERDNYKTKNGYASVKINQATYTDGIITHANVTTDYEDGMDYYSIASLLNEDFEWDKSSTTNVNVTDDEGINEDIIYTGNDNYKPYKLTIKLIVHPATITGISAEAYEGTYSPKSSYGQLYTVEGTRSDDVVTYSLSYDPDNLDTHNDWQSRFNLVSNKLKNAGVYTVYYKVTRVNYKDLIGSQVVTINKLAQTFSVVAPLELGYNTENKLVTISTSGNINSSNYTLTYSETATGNYTATAPECIRPGTYNFYVKPISDNYTFKDTTNANNDYSFVQFEVVKGTYAWENVLFHSDIVDNIEEIASENSKYYFDVSRIVDALSEIGITSEDDYSIEYSIDGGTTYVTKAPAFSTACKNFIVHIKLVTNLYENKIYQKSVSLVSIPDINSSGVANPEIDYVTGLFDMDTPYIFSYSLDNKLTWKDSDYNNSYTFDEPCVDKIVYYKITTYVYNEDYTNPEDLTDHWEEDKIYIYFFKVTLS